MSSVHLFLFNTLLHCMYRFYFLSFINENSLDWIYLFTYRVTRGTDAMKVEKEFIFITRIRIELKSFEKLSFVWLNVDFRMHRRLYASYSAKIDGDPSIDDLWHVTVDWFLDVIATDRHKKPMILSFYSISNYVLDINNNKRANNHIKEWGNQNDHMFHVCSEFLKIVLILLF